MDGLALLCPVQHYFSHMSMMKDDNEKLTPHAKIEPWPLAQQATAQ